mmetsp:Transcript_121710/g.344959  ORF Transcript_121710/g.344959 Transcript_121710/m.344959 type:complete len:132 (-) Transcript_121710:110-505(-)
MYDSDGMCDTPDVTVRLLVLLALVASMSISGAAELAGADDDRCTLLIGNAELCRLMDAVPAMSSSSPPNAATAECRLDIGPASRARSKFRASPLPPVVHLPTVYAAAGPLSSDGAKSIMDLLFMGRTANAY